MEILRVLNIETNCVVQSLRRAARIVTRRYEDALRPLDLTISQFTILQALSKEGKMLHGPMAESLGFEHTTLTRLLKPLMRRDLIIKERYSHDQRAILLSITTKGGALFNKAEILWENSQTENLARLNTNEWQLLREVLSKLSD